MLGSFIIQKWYDLIILFLLIWVANFIIEIKCKDFILSIYFVLVLYKFNDFLLLKILLMGIYKHNSSFKVNEIGLNKFHRFRKFDFGFQWVHLHIIIPWIISLIIWFLSNSLIVQNLIIFSICLDYSFWLFIVNHSKRIAYSAH